MQSQQTQNQNFIGFLYSLVYYDLFNIPFLIFLFIIYMKKIQKNGTNQIRTDEGKPRVFKAHALTIRPSCLHVYLFSFAFNPKIIIFF